MDKPNFAIKSWVFFVTLLTMSGYASAALIEIDWEQGAAGNNYLTRDTATGYEWLDLTVTANMSHQDVLGAIASGGSLEGFRYAIKSEVEALWSAGSVSRTPSPRGQFEYLVSYSEYDAVRSFVGMTGQLNNPLYSSTHGGSRGIYGGVWDDDGIPTLNFAELWYAYYDPGQTYVLAEIHEFTYATYAHASMGSYLVREASAVPLPPVVWLFISGLAGLVGFQRPRKHRIPGRV